MITLSKKIILQSGIIAWLMVSCTVTDKRAAPASIPASEHVPIEVAQAIEKEFPGALPYSIAIDSLLRHLSRLGISADQILWGQSTCVDDITNTKNKLVHPEIKGPFAFGGL